MTTFNRDRFIQRQQERKYKQAQREQNMLLLIDELRDCRLSAVIEAGEIIIYDEPNMLEILMCHTHEYFTRAEADYSYTLKHMLSLCEALDDTIALLTLLHTVWIARDYLRNWSRTIAKYERGVIKISVNEELSNIFTLGETNDAQ